MKVVVVDDHEVSQIGVKKILESNGYQVIGSFSSPDMALKFIEKCASQFVVIDLQLDNQGGLELDKEIKNIQLTGFTRKAFLTPKFKTCFDECVLKAEPTEDIIKALKFAEKGIFLFFPCLKKL